MIFLSTGVLIYECILMFNVIFWSKYAILAFYIQYQWLNDFISFPLFYPILQI